MIKRVVHGLTLVILIAVLVGCEGGTSGSVMGSRSSCSSGIRGGSCKGSYRKLTGTYSEDVETTRTGFQSVVADVTVSVDEGAVRVYLKAPDGTETSAEARPGSPAAISGPADASSYDGFRVYFEALDGTAQGVSYTIEFTYP